MRKLFKIAKEFEEKLAKLEEFSMATGGIGKTYNYKCAGLPFSKGEVILSGKTLPLKDYTIKSKLDPNSEKTAFMYV